MNNRKGLSQILYLIIAASVLMIAALSMVFMLDEGLSGVIEFGGDADERACERAIQTRCAGMADDHQLTEAPPACVKDGQEIPPASTASGLNCANY